MGEVSETDRSSEYCTLIFTKEFQRIKIFHRVSSQVWNTLYLAGYSLLHHNINPQDKVQAEVISILLHFMTPFPFGNTKLLNGTTQNNYKYTYEKWNTLLFMLDWRSSFTTGSHHDRSYHIFLYIPFHSQISFSSAKWRICTWSITNCFSSSSGKIFNKRSNNDCFLTFLKSAVPPSPFQVIPINSWKKRILQFTPHSFLQKTRFWFGTPSWLHLILEREGRNPPAFPR